MQLVQRFARGASNETNTTNFAGYHHGNAACLLGGVGSDRYQDDDRALEEITIAARNNKVD